MKKQNAHPHLNDVEMNYWQHLLHSFKQSNRLIVLAIKSYIHGVFPSLFEGAGPIGVYKIYKEIKRMHHVVRMFKEYDKNEPK